MDEMEMVTVTAADPRWEAADVTWPESEIEVAGRMARLCAVGLEVSVAASVARDIGTTAVMVPVHLGAGVWIGIDSKWSG